MPWKNRSKISKEEKELGSILNKLSDFKNYMMGTDQLPDDEEIDYEGYEEEEEDFEPKRDPIIPSYSSRASRSSSASSANSKIVNIHTNVQMQVVITYPQSVDESGIICDYIKSNKTVVVNLEGIDHTVAQRIVDFLGGVTYALDGDVQCISNKIFIVAPKNVDISGHFKEELKANGVFFKSFM